MKQTKHQSRVVAARLFKYFNRFACFFQSNHEIVCFTLASFIKHSLLLNKLEQYSRVSTRVLYWNPIIENVFLFIDLMHKWGLCGD